MVNQERLFTIGELARIGGVTVRTLQYYDEQNLLKPIITQGGRRKYTREDVLRLEQIIFLKSLGFSLEEINEKILDLNTSADLKNIFTMQRNALTGQIEQLNNIVGMLDTAIAETNTDQEINMDRLITIMESMKRGNPYAFVIRYFNDDQLKSFAIQLFTMPENMKVKEVFDKLKELYEKGVDPKGEEGQELAKRWWIMVNEFSSGDINLLMSLINAGLDISNWPYEARDIQEPIKNFLVKALNFYIHNNGFQLGIENTELEKFI